MTERLRSRNSARWVNVGNTPVSTGTAPADDAAGPRANCKNNWRPSRVIRCPGSANEANIQPALRGVPHASTQNRDLGSVADDIDKVTTDLRKELKPGNTIQVTGQIQSMNEAFRDTLTVIGLLFAAVFCLPS